MTCSHQICFNLLWHLQQAGCSINLVQKPTLGHEWVEWLNDLVLSTAHTSSAGLGQLMLQTQGWTMFIIVIIIIIRRAQNSILK